MSRPIKSIHDVEGDIRDLKRLANVMKHMEATHSVIEGETVWYLGHVLSGMADRIEAGLDAEFGDGQAVKP
ncbi:hypothetical protein WV31_04925 [Magnetospirillum sp. ME-1]|uniref:hypothetical protein n=1 Tax=Magnetospirillum sp. ME-1 TaxID=1639348 RepID=UPI000A17B8BA|nr:hypothetical protein [Magnetospirillum sp. ME-1]ARJ65051.1 hypothetical protein WV31_04925 [Magnetospirillum sp. ME-1]